MVFSLRHNKAIPDIPDTIVESMRSLWTAALSAANDGLALERESLSADKASMERLIDRAHADTAVASELAKSLEGMLQVAHETIAGRDETIKRLEQSLAELRGALAAKDERITDLTADLATKEAERASSAAETEGLRRATLLQIDQARGEARSWKAEYDRLYAESKASTSMHLVTEYVSKTTWPLPEGGCPPSKSL